MGLEAVVGRSGNMNRENPLLAHVDVLEVELDIEQTDVFACLEINRRGIGGIVSHVDIVEVGTVLEALVVEDAQRIALFDSNGEVGAIGCRTTDDDRQQIVGQTFAKRVGSVIVVAAIGHVDGRNTTVVQRSLETDEVLILFFFPLVVARGGQQKQAEQRRK